jgi:hypothetical protein
MRHIPGAGQRIAEELAAWPDVRVGPGARGASVAFYVGRREIGHLHGDHAAHFSFPRDQWQQLRAEGRIEPHPVFPHARGPAARRIESDADVRDVIELLRMRYERAVSRLNAAA